MKFTKRRKNRRMNRKTRRWRKRGGTNPLEISPTNSGDEESNNTIEKDSQSIPTLETYKTNKEIKIDTPLETNKIDNVPPIGDNTSSTQIVQPKLASVEFKDTIQNRLLNVPDLTDEQKSYINGLSPAELEIYGQLQAKDDKEFDNEFMKTIVFQMELKQIELNKKKDEPPPSIDKKLEVNDAGLLEFKPEYKQNVIPPILPTIPLEKQPDEKNNQPESDNNQKPSNITNTDSSSNEMEDFTKALNKLIEAHIVKAQMSPVAGSASSVGNMSNTLLGGKKSRFRISKSKKNRTRKNKKRKK